MYSPLYLNPVAGDPFAAFPAMRKWRTGATPEDSSALRRQPASTVPMSRSTLQAASPAQRHRLPACQTGARLREHGGARRARASVLRLAEFGIRLDDPLASIRAGGVPQNTVDSSVFRIPLDGSAPSALKVAGSPIDQFAFLEATMDT